MTARVITAISREDSAPRLFTHTTTLSPVFKKRHLHIVFKYKTAAHNQNKKHHVIYIYIINAPDLMGRCDWLSGFVM